jgi:hypothetical protein
MTEPQANNQNHRPGLRSSAERHDQNSVPPTYTHLEQIRTATQVSDMAASTNAIPLQTPANAAPGMQSTTIHTPPSALVPSRMTMSAMNAASSNSPTPQTSSAGAKMKHRCTITRAFSSSRINALIAAIALGAGIYYFYGQYIISYKTWELGIWKDCRDRAVRRNVRDNVQ